LHKIASALMLLAFVSLVNSLTIGPKVVIQPNSSAAGSYTINNTIILTELDVNSTNASFITLDISNRSVYSLNSSGSEVWTICQNYNVSNTNCTILQNSSNTTMYFRRPTPTFTLNSSQGWNITEGQSTTLNCTDINSQLTPSIYINTLLATNPYSFLWPPAVYSITCNNTPSSSFLTNSTSNSLLVQGILSPAPAGGGGGGGNPQILQLPFNQTIVLPPFLPFGLEQLNTAIIDSFLKQKTGNMPNATLALFGCVILYFGNTKKRRVGDKVVNDSNELADVGLFLGVIILSLYYGVILNGG
jgi:hypothetical protein